MVKAHPHAKDMQSQRGITLLEIVVSLAVTAIVMGFAVRIVLSSSGATRATMSLTHLNQAAHRMVEKIAKELISAQSESLSPVPLPPLGSSTITYQKLSDISGADVTWGLPQRIQWEPDPGDPPDGMDNNGNGVIDEGLIVLTRDVGAPTEVRVVLGGDIADLLGGEEFNGADDNGNGLIDERGLSFETINGVLFVRVTVQGPGALSGVASQTAETGIRLRN